MPPYAATEIHWECGDAVRLIRNVRNDGTYPGKYRGDLLIKRGRIGHIVDIGTFLQDQIIYSVHFLEEGRIIGCRPEELIDIDEEWIESQFEFREWVKPACDIPLSDGANIPEGDKGQVIKVMRIPPDKVAYHIHFESQPGRLLQIPEGLLVSNESSTN
ncbi:MAG: nitrogen fixation protein NifZ [Gammaproteobacteria bacterium]|nr:MAG: nitrogen fixation protein NifZ [Gammaproteobacteria bacterium]